VEPEPVHPVVVGRDARNLVLELYGAEVGQHARVAVGMATLPLNNAVTIAAEVEFAP
jgi:hypothetical protein